MDGKAHTQESPSASPLGSQSEGTNTSARKQPQETPKSFAIFLAQLLLAVLIFRSFIFAPFSIPSESMLPRLMNGDILLAAKWPYGYSKHSLPFGMPLLPSRILENEPERGDIVIFKHPIDEVDYIKRVIGLPGDNIAIEDGVVILNGEPLPLQALPDLTVNLSPNTGCGWGGRETLVPPSEVTCRYTQYREEFPGGRSFEIIDFGETPADSFGPTTIPQGHMFLMGDNRDNSRDSRFAARSGDAVGIVSQDLLVGEATIILWSSQGSAVWYNPASWFTTVRWDRIGTVL